MPVFGYVAFVIGMRSEEDLARAIKFIMISSLIPVGSGIAEELLGVGFNYDVGEFLPGERPAGTIIDANLYGIYLSLTFFSLLPLVLAKPNRANAIYMLLVVVTIIISRNRGTWIALAIALMVAVPLFRRHLRIRYWVIGALVVMLAGTPVMLSRFGELKELDEWGQSKNTGAFRAEMATTLIVEALEAPIFGHGTGAAVEWVTREMGMKMPPHNDYVRVSYDFGFPATAVYIAFLLAQLAWTIRHRADRLWQYQFAACGAQVYLITISLAQNVLTEVGIYMMVFFVMALSHRAAVISARQQEARVAQIVELLPAGGA